MSIPDRKDFIIGDRESRIVSLREWTQNNKAAGRRLVVELSLCQSVAGVAVLNGSIILSPFC